MNEITEESLHTEIRRLRAATDAAEWQLAALEQGNLYTTSISGVDGHTIHGVFISEKTHDEHAFGTMWLEGALHPTKWQAPFDVLIPVGRERFGR